MNQRSRSALTHWARRIAAVAALSLGASSLWAQTGKIEGTVHDPAGQPVSGAQVLIQGTSFSAVTSSSGYYFINNVPSGTYTLRAQYIGFAPTEVENVRVLEGQTSTVDFSLKGAVQIGQINVTAQANPLVPRDQVTSKPIVTGQEIQQLPVDDVRAVLSLQPGVVESNSGDGLSIRGGRPGETAIYVDGVLVRSERHASPAIDLGTNSLEEASITTGATGVEFGHTQAGVIQYVTKAGGSKFSGSLTYASDAIAGSKSFGLNRYEGSLGGPLFGNLTFYVSGVLQGSAQTVNNWGADTVPSYVQVGLDTTITVANTPGSSITDSTTVGIPHFIQYGGTCTAANNDGYACQGRFRPWGFSTQLQAQGKLQYTYGSGSRLALSYVGNTSQGRGNNPYNPESIGGSRTTQKLYILNLVQQVFRGAEHALSFDVYASYQTEDFISGTLTRQSELESRDPSGGVRLSPLNFVLNKDHFSDDNGSMYNGIDSLAVTKLNTQQDWNQLVYNLRTNQGTRVPYLQREDLRTSQPYRFNPWGLESDVSTSGGVATGLTLSQERRWYGRANIDWQFDRYNRFRFGGEYLKARVNYYNGGTITQIFNDIYTDAPSTASLYGEDHLDLGDVVLVAGLRWDRYSSGAYFPTTPARTFTLPNFDPQNPLGVFTKASAHTALSPHVQVSFPVTDKTDFRLSYEQATQSPDFNIALAGHNNDISITNTNDTFGGDVYLAKTISFEFGIRHAFSPDMILDVSAYNKDNVGNYGYRIEPFFDPVTADTLKVNVLENSDFGNSRGIDFQMIKRIGNYFNGQVSYTYSVAKNTGSDPFTYLSGVSRQLSQVTGDREPAAQAINTTNFNRQHNVAGAMSFNFPHNFAPGHWYGSVLQDGGIFATFRFASGLPYTPCVNKAVGNTGPGNGVCAAPADQLGPVNSARMPWVKYFDLRVNKGLSVGPTDWTVFLDIRNLFNFKNLSGLFIETGDIVNRKYETEQYVQRAVDGVMSKAPSSRIVQVASGDSTVAAVDLRPGCSQGDWGSATLTVNCYMLKQVESRFGNGDGVLDVNEQSAAFDAAYQAGIGSNAPWEFLQSGRQIRAGVEVNF